MKRPPTLPPAGEPLAPKSTKKRASSARKPLAMRKRAAGKRTSRKAPTRKPAIAIPPGWRLDRGGKSMSVSLEAKDFLTAMDLLNEIARVAEDVEHHPDLHVERWNRVRVATYSHDVGKLTDRDARLAARINEVLAKRGLLPP